MSAIGGYPGAAVVTGEAVALELRHAGIASRALALAIDFAIQTAILIAVVLVLAAFAVHGDGATAAAVGVTLYVLLVVGYPVGFETLARGRTPGKMALGLRVVRDDGGPIRFRHALVRGLVGVVLERPGISFGSVALIAMLISKSGKRVGDMAAGTVVLRERVPVRLAAAADMPPGLGAWAAGLDLSGVPDDLALRVRQFLSRAGDLDPEARERVGGQMVADVVSRTGAPVPSGVPGWAYLTAVLAERRRRELARAQQLPPTDAHVEQPPVGQPPGPAPASPAEPEAAQHDPKPGGFAPPA